MSDAAHAPLPFKMARLRIMMFMEYAVGCLWLPGSCPRLPKRADSVSRISRLDTPSVLLWHWERSSARSLPGHWPIDALPHRSSWRYFCCAEA